MRAIFLLLPALCAAQDFVQRGFLDYRGLAFPQTTPTDDAHFTGDAMFRYEIEKSLFGNLRLMGATETRIDTHRQIERRFFVNWSDRTLKRPAFSIRRLSFLYSRRRVTIEAGKQAIRWGKADILNPTDRFAPRDFLSVVDNEFLPVSAARVIYEGKSDSFEIVFQPRFTPSRTPLVNRRWTVIPEQFSGISIQDLGSRVPGGPQVGARWNHLGKNFEGSISFYEGYNHLPLIDGQLLSGTPGAVVLTAQRYYPQLRLYGADAAIPLRWFAVKAEAGYFTSTAPEADEYVIYVLQLERQIGELSIVAGYAGEVITKRRNPFGFAPDRGLAKAFLGRAAYTIDPESSVALEYAVRQNGNGVWIRAEYSRSLAQNWRVTAGATIVRGDPEDFLGQYRRNSHASVGIRYSF